MYFPIAGCEINPLVLIYIGFCVGVLGGFFGIGGAFMVTPALNLFGFPMAYAIGTDLAHIMGKSIIATIRHKKLGNVDLKLGLLMLIGTAMGVELGKDLIITLEKIGKVDIVVRIVYMFILGGIGTYMVYDYFLHTREIRGGRADKDAERDGTLLSKRLHGFFFPPMVSLPESNIKSISLWAIILVGFVTGFMAGFLGVGGGFIRVPALIYTLGVPTTVAVGTDLFEIIFSSGIGAFVYAMEGKVDIIAAAVMLIGAAVGAQIGATATGFIRRLKIRLYFAITIFLTGFSVFLKILSEYYGLQNLGSFAGYIILVMAGLMTLFVIRGLVRGIIESKYYKESRGHGR